MVGIRADALMPTERGDVKHAETLLVSWGSNRGVMEEALEVLNTPELAGLHFHQVYPLPVKAKKLFVKKKVIVLENNAGGQFANLLLLEYGIKVSDTVLQYDGNPFAVEDVVARLRALL